MSLEVDISATLGGFALDVAFSAPTGVTALFGPSGAGKTSVVRAVAGLLRPAAGRIAVADRVLFDSASGTDVPAARRRLGYVFQEPRLFPHLTVAKNLGYGGPLRGEVVELLGIGPLLDRPPAALSGGEAQRVALGRALCAGAEVLLLDEPLAGLDAPRKDEILPYLERLKETGVPMLYVSHAIDEVARLADSLVVLEAGRVARSGPLADLLSDPAMTPLLGPSQAGAVLVLTVRHHGGDGLSVLDGACGALTVPGHVGRPGARVRVRIRAQDIILATEEPRGLSALTVWPAQVTALAPGAGPGMAVGLACGSDRLVARVTKRSARAMNLTPGMAVWAIIKASTVAAASVGGPGSPAPEPA